MSAFLIATALLSLLAMAFVTVALLRGQRGTLGADRRSANVALYRERLAELDVQRNTGAIDAAEHEALAAESAAALLEDAETATQETVVPVATRRSWKIVLVIGVTVVGAAALVYRELGAIDLVNLDRDRALLSADGEDEAALAHWAERLERHLARHPDDAKIWYLLGHARMRQGNYRAAVTAFETLQAQAGGETAVLTALAQARYLADDGVISDQNRALMNRIIAVAPHDSVVREILALDAFRAGRFEEAAGHLENALAGGAGGARADAMRTALDRARAAVGGAEAGGPAMDAPGIDVAVTLGSVDAAAHPGGALFVFARRMGQRMPILVARVPAVAPITRVRLDGRNAMQPGVLPTAGEGLEIVARFSPSGRVGDEPGAQEAAVSVVWAETASADLAFGAAAPPATAIAVADRAASPVRLRVALQPGLTAPAGSRVFVILREPGGPPMPVAVRPLDPGQLPAQIEMSDADAMQPGRVISQFTTLEAVARLSASGTAMRQAGDLQSDAVSVSVGAPATVSLLIGGE